MQSVIFPTITIKNNNNEIQFHPLDSRSKGNVNFITPSGFQPPTPIIIPTPTTFPTVLNFNNDDTPKTNIDGKKILFVLDGTGSMGEYINYSDGVSKAVAAKKLIEQLLSKRPTNDYDVMVFNNHPYPVCKVSDIPNPNGSTFFSPLVNEIVRVVTPDANYCAVVFLSDGLPSEPMDIARDSIRKIGNTTREMNCNPVAVAIGQDADGDSCALFAGNRGFNCYINEMKKLEDVASDINHGIDCKYKMLENGQFIPIEADGKYYFVGNDALGTTIAPNKFLIEKYLNLVIMQHINNPRMFDPINELVASCSKLLDDPIEQKYIMDRFHKIIKVVQQNYAQNAGTPGLMSSGGACYRAASQQV
jgi:hypothetical protein